MRALPARGFAYGFALGSHQARERESGAAGDRGLHQGVGGSKMLIEVLGLRRRGGLDDEYRRLVA